METKRRRVARAEWEWLRTEHPGGDIEDYRDRLCAALPGVNRGAVRAVRGGVGVNLYYAPPGRKPIPATSGLAAAEFIDALIAAGVCQMPEIVEDDCENGCQLSGEGEWLIREGVIWDALDGFPANRDRPVINEVRRLVASWNELGGLCEEYKRRLGMPYCPHADDVEDDDGASTAPDWSKGLRDTFAEYTRAADAMYAATRATSLGLSADISDAIKLLHSIDANTEVACHLLREIRDNTRPDGGLIGITRQATAGADVKRGDMVVVPGGDRDALLREIADLSYKLADAERDRGYALADLSLLHETARRLYAAKASDAEWRAFGVMVAEIHMTDAEEPSGDAQNEGGA